MLKRGRKSKRRLARLCPITQNLDEADNRGSLANGRHFSSGPEPRTVLAQPPPFLATAASMICGIGHFALELAGCAILFQEEPFERFANHRGLAPSENAMRTFIPARDEAVEIGADDGSVGRAVYDLPPLCRRDGQRNVASGRLTFGHKRRTLKRAILFRRIHIFAQW
jgi:hypothetical protein